MNNNKLALLLGLILTLSTPLAQAGWLDNAASLFEDDLTSWNKTREPNAPLNPESSPAPNPQQAFAIAQQ